MVWANALAGMLGLGWSNLVFNDSTGPTIFLAARKNHHGKPSGQGRNHLPPLPLPSFGPFAVIRALAFVLALVLALAALRTSRPRRRKRLRPPFGDVRAWESRPQIRTGRQRIRTHRRCRGWRRAAACQRSQPRRQQDLMGQKGMCRLCSKPTRGPTLLHHLLNWEPEFVLILQSTPPCSGPG